jgi:hypothetical protein
MIDSAIINEAVDLLECAGWKGYAQAVREQQAMLGGMIAARDAAMDERNQYIAELSKCVCHIDDGLVQEWVSKARAVARSKGFTVSPRRVSTRQVEPLVTPSKIKQRLHGSEPSHNRRKRSKS